MYIKKQLTKKKENTMVNSLSNAIAKNDRLSFTSIVGKPKNLTVSKFLDILDIDSHIGEDIKLKKYFYSEIALSDNIYNFFNTVRDHYLCNDFTENFNFGNYDPDHGDIKYLSVNEIKLDPARFQFKIVHGSTGSTGSLKSVEKWNTNLSGILLVWLDPSDNLVYCVNGHNRLSKAKKLNVENIAVKFIKAKNHIEARTIGALCNIAEGNGSIFDIAKFLKDSSYSLNTLREYGINTKNKLVTSAGFICNLQSNLFQKFMIGDIPINYAIFAGSLDQNLQDHFLSLCFKKDKTGAIPDQILNELSLLVKNTEVNNNPLLFNYDDNSLIQKSELMNYCLSELKKDKNLFTLVSRETSIKILEGTSNKLDTENNKERADIAVRLINCFDQLKYLSGPLSDTLNKYSKILKDDPNNESFLKSKCYQDIRVILLRYVK
jgi:hypothetical protein